MYFNYFDIFASNIVFFLFWSLIVTFFTFLYSPISRVVIFEPAAWLLVLFFFGISFLLLLIPTLIFSFWIYKDAKILKIKKPFFWAFLSFILFPLPNIVYILIVRKEVIKNEKEKKHKL